MLKEENGARIRFAKILRSLISETPIACVRVVPTRMDIKGMEFLVTIRVSKRNYQKIPILVKSSSNEVSLFYKKYPLHKTRGVKCIVVNEARNNKQIISSISTLLKNINTSNQKFQNPRRKLPPRKNKRTNQLQKA